LAEFWYNTSYHTSLGKTPFEVVYGQTPRHFGIDVVASCEIPDQQQWLTDRKMMTQLLQQQLIRAQQRQKFQADKNRSERSFTVGEMVYVKLQPYVQTSVAARSNHKLSFRYFGPFKIIGRVGTVAYKLELPPTSMIHPVFHVSQLKKAISPSLQVSTHLPSSLQDEFRIPVKVLDRRLVTHNNSLAFEILVKWSSGPLSMATWEDEETLKREFPAAPAWGQPVLKEGGMSRQ